MSELGSVATIFDFPGTHEEIDALYQERGWTDGLPIVPPTEAAVREFLRWTDRDPREVLGVLPPRQGEATVERIAANAVMAGCRPEYLPVILAGIEALADPLFNLDAIQATTHPVAPLLVVNGPIAREIGLNAGYNAFGQGFRANVTIGRGILLTVAGAMGQGGSNNLLGRGWPLLSLGPEHAATIARDGYTKKQVKEFLFEHARFPLARLGAEYRRQQIEHHHVVDSPDTMLPIVRTPDDISVIVVGGAGKHSCWQPTFGDGTHFTRRTIARRDGSPLQRVADARR